MKPIPKKPRDFARREFPVLEFRSFRNPWKKPLEFRIPFPSLKPAFPAVIPYKIPGSDRGGFNPTLGISNPLESHPGILFIPGFSGMDPAPKPSGKTGSNNKFPDFSARNSRNIRESRLVFLRNSAQQLQGKTTLEFPEVGTRFLREFRETLGSPELFPGFFFPGWVLLRLSFVFSLDLSHGGARRPPGNSLGDFSMENRVFPIFFFSSRFPPSGAGGKKKTLEFCVPVSLFSDRESIQGFLGEISMEILGKRSDFPSKLPKSHLDPVLPKDFGGIPLGKGIPGSPGIVRRCFPPFPRGFFLG